MLTEIQLINFKSFTDENIPLLPLTLLAGLNNSGKSSIMQALQMIWKWVDVGDPTLSGHGSLKEIKNKNASMSASIKLACSFRKENNIKVELNIDFNHSGQPEIVPYTDSIQLPFMSHISADRWGPRVSLPMYTSIGDLTHVGEQGQYVIDFLSRHERNLVSKKLLHPKAEGETLEYNVRAWLEEISPNVNFKHEVYPQKDASYSTFDSFRPTNTGFGLSYTLPVIVSLLGMSAEWEDNEKQHQKTERGTLILLENPESHLHPKGQTSMGKLIALAVASGSQVIVETHSDHLMDGIRIAVKEGNLPAEITAFHYFEINNGITSVESPTLKPNGKIDYWPQGFFDQTMKNRAILARR